MQRSRNRFILAFGSNATDDVQSNAGLVVNAVRQINQAGLLIDTISRFWRTPAFPAGAGPEFVNACAVAEGPFSAPEALQILHQVEADLGRVRVERWGQRVIDIDLLAAGASILPDVATWQVWADLPPAAQRMQAPDTLVLPHPRLQDRGFVLAPMAEVAGDWVHPVLGRSVAAMLAALDATAFDDMIPMEAWEIDGRNMAAALVIGRKSV